MKQKRSGFELPAIIKHAAVFQGLDEHTIRKILDRASGADYPSQYWLYKQGEPAGDVFLVQSGLISLTDLSVEGEETLIRFIFPGEATGLVAISTIPEYVLSAQVLKSSRIIGWKRDAAVRLLREVPRAAANLLSITIADVVHYYHYIRRLKMDPLERRIEWVLNELSRALGTSTREGTVIEHGSYRRLAQLAGTNIYSVSRELSKLERRGLLRKNRGRIVLLSANHLARPR